MLNFKTAFNYFSILFKTSFESSWEMLGHQGENLYKIGPNKFMGGGGVCGRGEKGGAFCSVCIFHNQKMHVYLIFCIFFYAAGQMYIVILDGQILST